MSHIRKLSLWLALIGIAISGKSLTAQTVQEDIFRARDRVMPALVHIQPVIKNYNTGELEKQAVVGSGVIFRADGHVVTNYHVAGKADRIICTLFDKEQVPATYVGGDPMTDVAVIKLDLSEYHGTIQPARFGNSDSLQVGQYVMAMGSPLSLSRSVSAGVISTTDRYFDDNVRLPSGERTGRYNLWIQTDAAINSGNSGGPLVDLDGRVIGINSRATLFANNLGFAIPINIVKASTAAILEHGEVRRSWIGVHCQALQELEGFFNTDRDRGVLIASIDPGSPADLAFLKAGDIVLEVDDRPVSARFVEELPKFYSRIASFEPGSELGLKVLRDNETYSFGITTRKLGDLQGEDFDAEGWGFTVKAITEQMQIEYNLDDTLGVIVAGVKPGSAAWTGGLRPADVIAAVDQNPVNNLVQFIALHGQATMEEQKKILFTIHRTGSVRYTLLKLNNQPGDPTDE